MRMKNELDTTSCSKSDMIKYSLGGCTESLILNSFFGFSMLYYTKALGLGPELAGIATFIATLWDAVSDPIMGHISDNTKSRFGKRHSYMLFGGLAMVAVFFFIWYVPDFFKSDMTRLFWYLVVMNLLLRTAYTVFVVPYTALGFEICSDYADRSDIQGKRNALNMAANLCGPAMAWFIFFPNNTPGEIQDTQIAKNYINMGAVFAVAALVFLILMLMFTAKYRNDSRQDKTCHSDPKAFFRNIEEIVLDPYPRWVFMFLFMVLLGIVLVSTLQMYVFDDFMKLSGKEKTIAHGGTMVGMGLGSLLLGFFVRRFDKKGAIQIAVIGSVTCELILAALFLTGFMQPGQTAFGIPIAFMLFTFFHAAYWFGNGIMMPTALSMMADVSEIHKIKDGINKDASYAAMYSLGMKISMAISGLIAGFCLKWTGFQAGADVIQTPESVWRVCALTFVVGPVASLLALLFISRYPVNERFIENLRHAYAANHIQNESSDID